MTNPRPWFAATTLLVGLLAPTIAGAAALPVKIDAFEGEVVQVSGSTHSGVMPGKALQPGVEVKTGRDGRADLSLNGVPTLALGNDADLLLHSMDQNVLRVRVARGALRIDTRVPSSATGKARDVRLNAGDLRLRVANAEAWVEVSEQSGQVCLIAGVVEAQQPTGAVRLDIAGQCLRQTGHSSQWTMVPVDLLDVRVAATGVQRTVAAAAPKAPMQIKVLPLPGTLPEPVAAPAVVVLQQTPPTSTVKLKAVEPVDPPVVPDPPAALPVAPAPAPAVAMKMVEPVEVPVVPDAPPPLPVTPAPATTVALQLAEPVEVPVVPEPPAPLPVAPAPAETVAIKNAAPVESPEIPDAPAPPAPAVVAAVPIDPVPVPPPPADAPPDVVAPAPEPAPVKPSAAAPEASSPTHVALAPPASSTATTNAADDGRRWRVVLGSMPEKEKAEMEAERLNARGWAVEAREYHVGDRRGFRIGFGEFVARQDAQKALEEFLVQYPEAPAWLAKY